MIHSRRYWNGKMPVLWSIYHSLWGETPIQISNDNWKNGSYFSHTFFSSLYHFLIFQHQFFRPLFQLITPCDLFSVWVIKWAHCKSEILIQFAQFFLLFDTAFFHGFTRKYWLTRKIRTKSCDFLDFEAFL